MSLASSHRPAPPSRSMRLRCDKPCNDFIKPRIITIIRNGMKPRRVVRHLLNRRTAQSFEHVMQDITGIVNLNSGAITSLADFFGEDYVFVAYGPEKVSEDDFYVISEEYKRMNLRNGIDVLRGRIGKKSIKEMPPVRNDGFRRTLSPVPKSKMNQVMQLPEQLAERIKVVDLLGDGNTALVFKALFKDSRMADSQKDNGGESVSEEGGSTTSRTVADALKIISKEYAEEMLDFIETEIQLLSEISHDCIVGMKEYYVVDNSWYIRMELMESGDLFEYLMKERTLDELNSASSIECLCRALDYLHDHRIVHRDVKPENLLIYKCPASGLLKLKLADFGLACKLKDGELLYHLCGTPTYVAPEVLAEYGYSFKADCWSVGIILYILLCGFPPFGMDEDLILFGKIIRGIFDFPSPSFDDASYAVRWLIRCLLNTEPEKRFSARQVLDDHWVTLLLFRASAGLLFRTSRDAATIWTRLMRDSSSAEQERTTALRQQTVPTQKTTSIPDGIVRRPYMTSPAARQSPLKTPADWRFYWCMGAAVLWYLGDDAVFNGSDASTILPATPADACEHACVTTVDCPPSLSCFHVAETDGKGCCMRVLKPNETGCINDEQCRRSCVSSHCDTIQSPARCVCDADRHILFDKCWNRCPEFAHLHPVLGEDGVSRCILRVEAANALRFLRRHRHQAFRTSFC